MTDREQIAALADYAASHRLGDEFFGNLGLWASGELSDADALAFLRGVRNAMRPEDRGQYWGVYSPIPRIRIGAIWTCIIRGVLVDHYTDRMFAAVCEWLTCGGWSPSRNKVDRFKTHVLESVAVAS